MQAIASNKKGVVTKASLLPRVQCQWRFMTLI